MMEHLSVPARDATLHVARAGKGPVLLLLHGWPEFWLTWEPVMQRLADRFTLIAPDLPSFGDSESMTRSSPLPGRIASARPSPTSTSRCSRAWVISRIARIPTAPLPRSGASSQLEAEAKAAAIWSRRATQTRSPRPASRASTRSKAGKRAGRPTMRR